jgi:hypothetical protein
MTAERLDTEARKYVKLRRASEKADAAAKAAKAKLEEQVEVVHELMEDLNQPSAVLHLGGDIGDIRLTRPKPTIYSRVIDKDVALESIQKAGRLEEMFDSAIRKAPANQWIKECLERGEELPDGFDYSESQNLTLTYLKKKES